MWSIDWWLIDVCKKLCHMPPQKSGLFVKGLFTTKVLFSAEGSFVFFWGGEECWDSHGFYIWECLKKNTRGATKINHFQRILGRSLLSVTYPYDVIHLQGDFFCHLRFPWIDKHQGTSNHVFKCNFWICDARLWLQYPVGKWFFSSNCGTILGEYNDFSESPIEQHHVPHLPINIANEWHLQKLMFKISHTFLMCFFVINHQH